MPQTAPSSADTALQPTYEKANFSKLTQLLMCGGIKLVRDTFDSLCPPATLPSKLGSHATKQHLKWLRDYKKVLTQLEWKKLYPSPGIYGKSTDFDIALLFKLLRNICCLTRPSNGWDKLPLDTDYSLEADLVRIKYYRNALYAHSETMEVSNSDFHNLWGKISAALLRIAGRFGSVNKDEWQNAIDEFHCKPSTPDEQRYLGELHSWYKKDMEIKDEVEKLRRKMEKMESRQGQMSVDIHIIAQYLQQIRGSAVVPGHLPGSFAGQFHAASEPSGQPSEYVSIPVPPEEPQFGAMNPTTSGDPQTYQPDSPADVGIWHVILSFKASFALLVEYVTVKLGGHVVENRLKCLIMTVSCCSLDVLDRLWEDYQSGHLDEVVQETLVTAEVLQVLGLHELKLKTTIPFEEYQACKQFLTQMSDVATNPPTDDGGKRTLGKQDTGQAVKKSRPQQDWPGDVPSLQRHNPMIEQLLRQFAECHFSEDGHYYPVSNTRNQQIKPLVLMVKEQRSCTKRPLKKYNYTALGRMEKFVVGAKEKEFLDALNLHVGKDHPKLELEDEDDSEDDDEEMESAASDEHAKIRMKDGKGYLDLGRVDRDFIDDEKVRKILANTELDSSKMKAFKDQQLRLITSVICSERFEHKGRGATEDEKIPDPYSQLKGLSARKLVSSRIATRNTRGPFLFKCCRVVYNEETNRLEVGSVESERKRGDDEDDEEEDDEYENTVLNLEDEESQLADFFTDDDNKKLQKIVTSVLQPTKNRQERKQRVSKYQQWFEKALATESKTFLPDESLTEADRIFLRKTIFAPALPNQKVVDLSDFRDEKLQGYAIVLKIIAGLSDAQWDEIEKAWAESGKH